MKRLLIIIMSFSLLCGTALAADYDGDKKSDEIAAHGGSVATTTRIFIQDPVDTDIVTYATAQEIATAVLGAAYDTTAELESLFSGKQDASAVLDTYASIDPSADVQSVLGAATEAAIREFLDLEAGTDFYSVSAADLAFEAIDSNDFDPDRLAGDTDDDNLIDAALIDINGATAETEIAADDKVLIYDTSGTAVKAITRGNFVTGIGAGQAVTLDIGDDGGNDSTDIGEIATTGDTNDIFTESSADKLLIDLTNNWPTADAAVAAASQVITDNAIATVDDADAADNDFAKFTAAGLEGRSYAEVREDLGIDTAANLETSLSLGAYASDILSAADSDALVTLLGLVAGDIPDLSETYEGQLANSAGLAAALSDETGTGVAVFGTNPTLTGATLGGNLAVGAHEIQSTGNIVLQLGDAAGSNVFEIEDSAGVTVFTIDSDGGVTGVSLNDPYNMYLEDDAAQKFATRHNDDTTDAWEVGYVAAAQTSVTDGNFTELLQIDLNGDMSLAAGGMNIPSGEIYKVNGTQIALANLSDGAAHASRHIQSGADEIDGDLIDIDYAQTNYTPATTGVATDVNHLAAHLEGIDNALGASGTGTIAGMTDTDFGSLSGGHLMIWDGTDDWENKAVSGDATLASDGALTIAANAIENSMMADNSVDSSEYVDNSIDPEHISDWYAYDEIPVAWMQDGTSAPAALDDASTRSPYVYRAFDSTADEDLNFVWFVPSDLSGSTIQYRVKYLITNATGPSATEGVAFGLSGVSAGDNDATNGTKGTVVVVTDDTLNAAQHDVMITGWSGDVTVTSLAAGEVAEMALIRDVSDAVDDYGQDVGVLSVEIRYVQNVTR